MQYKEFTAVVDGEHPGQCEAGRPGPTTCGQCAAGPDSLVFAALLDLLDTGLVLVEPASSTVLHANRAARHQLENGSVLLCRAGRLVAAERMGQEQLVRAMAAALRGCQSLLFIPGARTAVPAAVVPLSALAGCDTALCAVLIAGAEVLSTLALQQFAQHFRLTPAEQAVLHALLLGRSPRQIAADGGVGIATVRTQINAVREKVGVASVRELLLFACRLPPVSSRCLLGGAAAHPLRLRPGWWAPARASQGGASGQRDLDGAALSPTSRGPAHPGPLSAPRPNSAQAIAVACSPLT